jgi:Ca2+-binding RTX toxin-like protein
VQSPDLSQVYSGNIAMDDGSREFDAYVGNVRATGDVTHVDGTHSQTAYIAGQTLIAPTSVADTLTGFGSNDVFLFHAGFGADLITNMATGMGPGHDVIQIDAALATSLAQLTFVQAGSDVQIFADAGNLTHESILVQNALVANVQGSDFRFV